MVGLKTVSDCPMSIMCLQQRRNVYPWQEYTFLYFVNNWDILEACLFQHQSRKPTVASPSIAQSALWSSAHTSEGQWREWGSSLQTQAPEHSERLEVHDVYPQEVGSQSRSMPSTWNPKFGPLTSCMPIIIQWVSQFKVESQIKCMGYNSKKRSIILKIDDQWVSTSFSRPTTRSFTRGSPNPPALFPSRIIAMNSSHRWPEARHVVTKHRTLETTSPVSDLQYSLEYCDMISEAWSEAGRGLSLSNGGHGRGCGKEAGGLRSSLHTALTARLTICGKHLNFY